MSRTEKLDNNLLPSLPRVPALQTVSFATLGCKTNQFETAAMHETLQKSGYQVVAFDQGADLVIVNTCTVTSATDAQSRNLVRRARRLNDACRVVVTGCYAQVDPKAFQDMPGVSLVIGNEEKQRLLDFLKKERPSIRIEVSDISQAHNVCLPPLSTFAGRSRAFVQIQNGCNAYCTYCIIPYARGASRSAPPDDILKQVAGLIESGCPEIVLTGIHIGGYGADFPSPLTLNDLVRRLEHETDVQRLRLGSIEPTELTDELLETVATSQVICPHFHIPMQAGEDNVLQRMGRTYNTALFARLIDKVRSTLPHAAICLDVITGFPGETDREFLSTFEFISRLPITDLHVFPYSKRKGTPAATLPDQVSGRVSKERAYKLRRLAAEKKQFFAEGFIGQTLDVVVESGAKDGLLKGVSGNYLDVRFPGDSSFAGARVLVSPFAWKDGVLQGKIVA